MATFSIDELITPITADEFKASHYAALASVGVTTTTWKSGAVTRTIIAIVSVCFGAFSTLISNIARSGFLALASGLWARLHARYTYNVEALDADFAAGPVLVSNSSGGIYIYDPGELELAHSVTNARYTNTALVTIGAGAVDVSVAMQAVEAGSASSALVDEIDTCITADVGLSCRNAVVLVGRDDESDDLLKVRCSEKLGAFSPNGPGDAYSVAARAAVRASTGVNVGVNRIRTQATGHCGINVYVATPSGGVAGTVGDLSSDLGAVDEAIQRQAVPLTVTANTYSATPKVIDVAAQVWCYNVTGLTEAQIVTAVGAALATYFASPLTAPIGGHSAGSQGYIWPEHLATAIMSATANGASIRAYRAVVTPTLATLIGFGEVPTLGATTITITRTAPPAGSV